MLKKPSTCHYFNTSGKCRFGKHCRFLHDLEITSNNFESLPDNKDEAVNKKSVSIPYLETKPHSFRSNTRKHSHGSVSSERFVSASVFKDSSQDRAENNHRDGSLNKPADYKQEASKVRSTDIPICKYYAETRFCRFENQCRFQHINKDEFKEEENLKNGNTHGRDTEEVQDEAVEVIKDAEQIENVRITSKTDQGKRKQSKKVCYFYNKGYCRLGRNCGFLHPGWNGRSQTKNKSEKVTKNEKPEMEVNAVSDVEKEPAVVKMPQITHCYKRDDVSTEQLDELRATEIRQLKRRFTTDALKTIEENGTFAKFVFSFSPTDPDWPFEVKVFDIAVSFTEEYPLKLFTLGLPKDQDLPETVRRYIEVGLEEWVKMKQEQAIRKGTVELLFRPFLRWLDRNMEELVTQALKQYRRELSAQAAGMEFKSATQLRKEYNQSPTEEVTESEEKTQSEDTPQIEESVAFNPSEPGVVVYRKSDKTDVNEVYEVPKREQRTSEGDKPNDNADESHDDADGDESPKSDNEADGSEHQRPKIDPDTERRGTQLAFKNMQMWYCTTILMEKLQLTIQCERCKHTTDFHTPPNRVNSITCGKCHAIQMVVFRAALAHSYSSTFGFLDLDGCTVFDINMQECHFSMGCIMCQRDVLVKRCTPGKLLEQFCRSCHNKMQFAAESVKTTKLTSEVEQSFFAGKVHKVNSKMLHRAAKDPAIQEGKPLPNNGACKHYKKSFRWLRFPCCGKCYPCDECHDDKEDHEMKYANRMICGFCCKEQPYAAEKACTGCSSALTKVHTQHWEGGKGCRNKIAMSRNDDKKYSNMNKTLSRKSQELKDKSKGKKNTKLRHA